MPFECCHTALPGVLKITCRIFSDTRGCFAELYKRSDFQRLGIIKPFVQVNYSQSAKGVLRGLHYQTAPKAQAKLVSAVSGAIWDVAVDIRKDSPHYGKWVGETLSADNGVMLYIPEGFAHGFIVLSEQAHVMYQCSEEYATAHEQGIIWNDPALNISWPIPNPVLSEK
ncbi:MAG: dTDP-4-dehydrorhamnose 3,5-epimerase, partial [Candidatus Omnitrophica bacterium]|nr:dTDP-4-dehydrorhamnose 3,5-epimerase [Candidatus Omnitrophota bacterium]